MDRATFEAAVVIKIAEAKKLVQLFRTPVPSASLEKLEQDIRAAFRHALDEAPLCLSTEDRIQRIKGRPKWEDVKLGNPDLTPVKHIMDTYPDRKELGMLRRDLNEVEVDPQLYQALADWLRPKRDGTRNQLPSDFDLPKKSEATEIALAELSVASRSLTSSLEPADARLARAVNARHSRTYRARTKLVRQSHRLAAE